jgi:hypothetical protein
MASESSNGVVCYHCGKRLFGARPGEFETKLCTSARNCLQKRTADVRYYCPSEAQARARKIDIAANINALKDADEKTKEFRLKQLDNLASGYIGRLSCYEKHVKELDGYLPKQLEAEEV